MRFKHLWAGAALAGALCGTTAALAATELNSSVWFPENHPLSQGHLIWARNVEKMSKGDIKVKVFTGTALLPATAHYSGLRDGVAHVTYHAGTYTPSDLPEDNILQTYGIAVKNHPMVTTFAVADFYLNDPTMQAMFKRQKIVFLGAYASVPYNLMCRTKVEKLADLKGLKLRTPAPIYADWVRSVGATPVNVPSTEMFTGLDKGQLDCVVMGSNELKTRSLWDVAKFTNTANLGTYFAGWEWAMHGPTWQKLSAPQRRVVLDAISDSTVEMMLMYVASEPEAHAEAPSKGVQISRPSADLEKSLNDFAAQARATAVKEGAERFKVKDSEGLVSRFEATLAKWEKLLKDVDKKDAAALKTVLRNNLYNKVDPAKHGL